MGKIQTMYKKIYLGKFWRNFVLYPIIGGQTSDADVFSRSWSAGVKYIMFPRGVFAVIKTRPPISIQSLEAFPFCFKRTDARRTVE